MYIYIFCARNIKRRTVTDWPTADVVPNDYTINTEPFRSSDPV